MGPLPPRAWGALAVLAFVATSLLIFGAFTRFDGEAPPPRDDPGFAAYEKEQYGQARLSAFLGLAGAFALLASAACAQQAWRGRARP
jgi:hypothetical protein